MRVLSRIGIGCCGCFRRTTFSIALVAASLFALAVSERANAFADNFVGLGFFPHPSTPLQSYALGVSADGSVAFGYGFGTGAAEAFRWTQSSGITALGFLTGGNSSEILGGNSDGSVLVGYGPPGTNYQAFRWTQTGGMVGLGYLPGGNYSSAQGVSGDGSVVVGYSLSAAMGSIEAFRWTQAGGMIGLGALMRR